MVSAKSPVGACVAWRECCPQGRRIGYGHQEAADEQAQDGECQGHEEAEGGDPRPARVDGHGAFRRAPPAESPHHPKTCETVAGMATGRTICGSKDRRQ